MTARLEHEMLPAARRPAQHGAIFGQHDPELPGASNPHFEQARPSLIHFRRACISLRRFRIQKSREGDPLPEIGVTEMNIGTVAFFESTTKAWRKARSASA